MNILIVLFEKEYITEKLMGTSRIKIMLKFYYESYKFIDMVFLYIRN